MSWYRTKNRTSGTKGYWKRLEESDPRGFPIEAYKCSKCKAYGDSKDHICHNCKSPMAVEGADYVLVRRKNGNYERRKLK